MNRKKFFLLCVSTLASLCVWAQVQYADPYLSDDTRPNASLWLPEPPSQLSGEFYNDYFFYVWGKSQREERGEEAVWNSTASLNEVFSESMGIAISPELTPEIWKLASGATSDAMAEKKRVKNLYQRIRPFTTFGEPSLTPETDEEDLNNYLTMKQVDGKIEFERLPVRFWGNMKEEYEAHNKDYTGVYKPEN